MTLSKVRGGDVLAGLGGLGLLIVMFVPWYHFLEGVYVGTRSVAASATEQNAWQAFSLLLVPLVLTALLGLAQLGLTAFERTTAFPVAAEVFASAIGTITAICVLVRLIDPPGPNFAADLQAGAWLGLLCVLAVVAGAVWSMRQEQRP